VRSAGAVASALLLAVAVSVCSDGGLVSWAVLAGVASAAAGGIVSDLPCGPLLGLLPPLGCFCCGNWGLLVPRDMLEGGKRSARGILPKLCEQILSGVLEVVELRGAQAGGVCTFVRDRHGDVDALRSRTVKPKRGRLATNLFQDFRWEIFRRAARGFFASPRAMPVVLLQGHSRFGTSSSPAVNETHPHQWLGSQREVVWRFDTSTVSWRREETTVCISVTHNGDFDAFEIYGQTVSNGTLGLWLSRVLHHTNHAKGDSPKFAGLMDLLVCQGRWFASVRYAFVRACMQHIDQASGWERLSPQAPNTVPSNRFFKELAEVFDHAWSKEVAERPGLIPNADDIEDLASAVQSSFAEVLSEAAMIVLDEFDLSDEVMNKFCSEACKAFFNMDLLTAIHAFFKHAEGTFGVSAVCTLWPNSIVLAAKGQPVSLAFDMERPIAIWSSEPSSLTVSWPAGRGGRPKRLATARWDLDDAHGEAVELRVFEGGIASDHIEAQDRGLLGGVSEARYFASPDTKSQQERDFHILIRGCSLDHKPEALLPPVFACRWVRLRAPPFKTTSSSKRTSGENLDPIEVDIRDIPAILSDIENSFTDRASLNRVSSSKFAGCLKALLKNKKDGNSIDVLIFGVENSLWVGQQFAADMKRIFPKLNILAISSNWILGMLQQAQGNIEPKNFAIAPQHFRLAGGAIALALSHSGTTYPTVWASRLVTRLFGDVNGFAMSADFDTVLANSIGQELTMNGFTGALFSTMAGVRPAEPATAATIAMHHTLTCLLTACAEQTAKRSGHRWCLERKRCDGECELDVDEVMDLKRLTASLLPASERICGMTEYRLPRDSEVRTELLEVGAYISSHLTEGWYSTFWMCFYVYVTVSFHVPLFSMFWSRYIAQKTELDEDDVPFQIIDYIFAHIDAHFYVFLAVLLMLLHRLICGRRLWTRFTARTLVIVDSTMNYKLLRAYGSKLGALAFPFTGFKVAGQNGEDHFVHEMTHLAQSDVILLVGRADGRLGTLAASEGATIMSTQQAKYICSRPSRGIEAISIGHNPWVKPGLFRRAVALPTDSRPHFLSQQLLGTESGPHAPGDVVAASAAYIENARQVSASHFEPFAWVTKDILKQELAKLNITKDRVSKDDAFAVISNIVKSHAEALDIDPAAFLVGEVCPTWMTRSSLGSSDPGTPKTPMAAQSLTASMGSLPALPATSLLQTVKTFRSKGTTTEFDTLSLSNLLAVLRGRRMHSHIRSLQVGRKSEAVKEHIQARDTMIDIYKGVRKCFNGWAKYTLQMSPAVLRRQSSVGPRRSDRKSEVPTAEWRVQEEFRRRRRQHFMQFKAIGIEGKIFHAWHTLLHEDNMITPLKAYLTSSMNFAETRGGERLSERKSAFAEGTIIAEEKDALPISGRLAGQAASGSEMLDGLRPLERLYETRVAAAERLLASYVVLHRAVKPLSTLRFLRYDLDRSESRLRVASTPAPVPFVEELPECIEEAGMVSVTSEEKVSGQVLYTV